MPPTIAWAGSGPCGPKFWRPACGTTTMMKIAVMIRNKPETRFSQATTVKAVAGPEMRAAANCLDRAAACAASPANGVAY